MPSLDEWKAFSRQVEEAAISRWDVILEALAGSLLADALKRPGYHGPCPVHGGKDGFRLFRDYRETGGGICNQCGAFPSGFKLLMWLRNAEFKDVVVTVGDVLGLSIEGFRNRTVVVPFCAPPKPAEEEPAKAEEIRKAHLRQYHRGMLLSHARAKPARRYLAGRGLSVADGELPVSLRFLPRANYYHLGELKGEWPALIAPMQDESGKFLNVHRIYLTEDGEKAPVAEVKQSGRAPRQGIMSGSAVRLAAIAPVLGVAEGIETALAVQQATRLATWATVNATLLEQFVPPSDVKVLLIWADLDRGNRGLAAAEKLALRMKEVGVLATILMPEGQVPEGAKGIDWLDVVTRSGKDALSGMPFLAPFAKEG